MNRILVLALFVAPLAAHAQAPRKAGDPSATAYQGGIGSPYSSRASNVTGSDTKSEIAPRLPNPEASGDDSRDLLIAADRALTHKQTVPRRKRSSAPRHAS